MSSFYLRLLMRFPCCAQVDDTKIGGGLEANTESNLTTGLGAVLSNRVAPAIGNNFIWVLVIGMLFSAWIATPYFLTSQNLLNILNSNVYIGCMVLGISFVLITGNIDLSIESNLILSSVVGGLLMKPPSPEGVLVPGLAAGGLGWPWPLALAAMLAMSALIGLLNGILVVKFRMASLMATLGTMILLMGIALVVGRGKVVMSLPDGFRYVGYESIGPIRVSIIFMAVLLIIAAIVLKKTTYGAHIYAVGGNRGASRAAGVNDGRVIMTAFVICGLLAGVSAWILMSRIGAAGQGISSDALFPVVAAAVIGGVSLYGGRGGVGGILGGVLLMGMITNVLNIVDIPSAYIKVATGAIIFIAISIDAIQRRKKTDTL